ncbi:MAG: ABC transporter ATP-binding protein [Zetaproteobacteria bacterium CG06_land_8_20_14_3_00_59_53]|nr:MAG: ABC transporter ATP-binding protein [Zetaproteobacteria bacterium CG2_30_59_37]PIO89916.1 MAG: ABC transporter ATP-binding protein [Zetaproteobacteria bacterium CG23_combo_of_CG06-09_8_20_14_all_59_86]PIQ64282.1 MAG: ABC transporter ATP-binding protein [Zetaproteobacteria bacterium CG11_big_fil_rev_8_21_14_0_20_59_439]PIU70373.1 MAG: ABC transporter ATP-binding protein [Zetaproteobacteria bacterium CG06_land_8_20_14_3_00_59_53]PIU97504.1 MAG: ABC transporter ATP-binding protein [Zetapro
MVRKVGSDSGLVDALLRLWGHLAKSRKRQIGILLILMLVSALAEVVSLGAVVPFLGILTAPEQVFQYPVVAMVANALGIASAGEMVLPLTVLFIAVTITASAVRVLFLWVNVRVSNGCGADLSLDVYERTLNQTYAIHVSRNSSEIISGIQKVSVAQAVIQAVLSFVSSLVLVVSIMSALIAINATVAISAAIGFGLSYGVIVILSRRRLERNSRFMARETTRMIKVLQEGLGGIRDILLDGTQSVYCDVYRRSMLSTVHARGSNQIMGSSPRYVMEAFGMMLIASLAYYLSLQEGGVAAAMPVLGALALGAQRILPAVQAIYSGWASMTGNKASLLDALDLLDQPVFHERREDEIDPLMFSDRIRMQMVRFKYVDRGPWVLDGLNLAIPKGSRVGFVGSTGSGKSTTLDLLMGLLQPTEGSLIVDDVLIDRKYKRAWQKTIAHVPQNIFLSDSSLAENIAFGVPPEKIDFEKVSHAAERAQISEFIEGLSEGYQTLVGERGVRISGGQRQRIGIARALYKQASVLVFDEATSALDNATEQAVVSSIDGLKRDLTILIVAHRLSTIRHCDVIFELDSGRVVAQGTYEHLLAHSQSFRNLAKVTE